MDRFVTVIKPSAVRRRQENGKEQQEQKQDVKYNPYQTNRRDIKQKSTAVSQKRKIEA